jgi:hypothetical protein
MQSSGALALDFSNKPLGNYGPSSHGSGGLDG